MKKIELKKNYLKPAIHVVNILSGGHICDASGTIDPWQQGKEEMEFEDFEPDYWDF